MSIQLQIAIPLYVTVMALVGIAIWRKFFKPEVLVIGLAALALGVCMTKSHMDTLPAAAQADAADSIDTAQVSLLLANRYMLEDQQEAAAKVLKELSATHGDDPQVTLAMARSALLRDNYAAAAQLYAETDAAPQKERSCAIQLATAAYSGETTVASYLENHGQDPQAYDVSANMPEQVDITDVRELVLEAVEEELERLEDGQGKTLSRAVEAAVQISVWFSGQTPAGDEPESVEELVDSLEKAIREEPALARNPHIRLARMQGLLLLEDYDALAQCLDSDVTTQELLVLAELYAGGAIREKDFPEELQTSEEGELILELCEQALENNRDSLTPEQLRSYEDRLDQMKERLDNPGLYDMLQGLQDQVYTGDDSLDSKAYLALAKLEEHSGNSELAADYIGKAVQTAGNSDDDNYRAAMNQVSQVVQGTSGGEIMNVSAYVDQALEHSLPAQVARSSVHPQEEDGEEQEEPFAGVMTQTINESTAVLNIGFINKDGFPNVSARVQIQSSRQSTLEQIRQNLQVYDCGSPITDFSLEKVSFERSRIVLLCDISGSMSGSEGQLKEAIIAFAEDMQPGEEVCVIGFASNVVFLHEFSGDKETVKGYADSIYTGGGTALYNAVLEAGKVIPYDTLSNNVIIAMTDGQDGNPAKEGQMRNYIGALSADKNVTLYTVGLGGDVDVSYLQTMAACGNGSFLYANTIDALEDFYGFIHGQLHNQYILTYTAKNTTKNQRLLEISMADEVGKAEKTYYLQEPEYTDEDSSSYNPYVVEDTDITIYGFTTKFAYRSTAERKLTLRGEGFDAGDDITVRISGNVEYVLAAEFTDATTYTVTLPGEVCVGVYDLSVSVRGESVKLEDELTVAIPGDQKTFRFGSYIFTALSAYRNDDGSRVLSGNVMMNGWLHFKGDLIIQGEEHDDRIRVTDSSGAYISYASSTALGLAKTMADKGIAPSLGELGTFVLYGDPYSAGSMDSFRVQEIDVLEELNVVFLKVENLRLAIYPDALEVQIPKIKLELPLQRQLLRNLSMTDECELETELDMLLTATRIALTGEAEYSTKRSNKPEFDLISLPLRVGGMKLKVDTLKNEYNVLIDARLKSDAQPKSDENETYFKVSFGIKDGCFDALGFQTDAKSVSIVKTPIPVDMSNFGFELSGFSQYKEDDNVLEKVLNTDIKIKFQVDVARIDDYVPGIEEVLDKENVSLATLEDCELSLKLKELRISFTAKVKFCTVLDIGSCQVSMGKFNYTNALIGYYDETEYGLNASVTIGSDWKTTNISLLMTGRLEVTLGYPYSGVWVDGDMDFDVGWWLLKKDFAVSGDAMIGVYKNTSGYAQFSFIVKGSNRDGKTSGFHVYVTEATGLGAYTY